MTTTPPWVPPTPRTPIYRRGAVQIAVVAVLVLVIIAVLVVALSGGKSKSRVVGQFVLGDTSTFTSSGQTCTGSGTQSGLKSGGYVTLYGENQDYLGSTTLNAGILTGGACSFNFDLGKVDSSPASFTVVVASRYRATKSKADLKSAGYAFYLREG